VNRNGCAYEGEWAMGKKDGEGSEIYVDSDGKSNYVGQFIYDKKHGKGVYQCTAYTYNGEFDKGQVNGYGKMTWTGGKKLYTGSWYMGKRHGKGRYEKKGQFMYESFFFLVKE
jgi:hypothetical protein